MSNIPQEKYPSDPEGTAEPHRDSIYLDYGPLLPDSYHQDIIVALIRDPECIFCYWELSGTAVTTALGNATVSSPCEQRLTSPCTPGLGVIEPNLKWILRVLNLSQKSFNDIVLSTPQNYSNIQGNYYLTVLPETEYQLEFGVLTADNRFISFVKSNTVTTPRRNKAPMIDITSRGSKEHRAKRA
jgi:hypothetical protein